MKVLICIYAVWILPSLVNCHEEEYDAEEWTNEMLYEFPDVGNDLTKVTWEHAVNTQAKLKKALKGDAMFIEADVSIGRYSEDTSGETLPIMAHPPDTKSDLTLQQFLDQTLQSDKHIKLDFKSRMAFSASEYIITEAQMKYSYSKRIWLNADIIPGPINCTKPVVDADYFLSTCVAKFPDSVISPGWSTCYSQDNQRGGYTAEQIENMTDALNKNMVMGSVTFPMRAGIAAQSIERIEHLMKTSLPETTLTIWSTPGDPVDVSNLSKLIEVIGRDRIFLDIPSDLYKQVVKSQHQRSTNSRPSSSSRLLSSSISILCAFILLKTFI